VEIVDTGKRSDSVLKSSHHGLSEHPVLIDGYGRTVNYVRISVTDRCDFRCVYCMDEDMSFVPRPEILTLEEIQEVVSTFVALGVNKVRMTGGEPLIRKGVLPLAKKLGQISGLDHFVLTTNGSRLEAYADSLLASGVERINISLDTLKPERFRALTRIGNLAPVLRGIEYARKLSFRKIKINAVILNGRNDDEIVDLVNYARKTGVDISFIEEMPLGIITEHHRAETYCSSDEIKRRISEYYPLTPVLEDSGGPARYYSMQDSSTRVGFISPHSHNFCAACNRVRVTTEGRLLLCLLLLLPCK